MPLLAAGNLAKLLLRDALHKPLEAGKHLVDVLLVHDLDLGPANELLDARHAVADKVGPQALVHLFHDQLAEAGVLALAGADVEDGVDEAAALEVGGADAPAHDEGLVGARGAEAVDQGAGGAALGDEAERREGRQEEGVRRAVDEVGRGDERGGEPDDGAVEADDEDLGVRGEGVGDVEVVGHEVLEPVAVEVGRVFARGRGAGYAHVCASAVERWLVRISGVGFLVIWFCLGMRARGRGRGAGEGETEEVVREEEEGPTRKSTGPWRGGR